jgi:hypothetical protein
VGAVAGECSGDDEGRRLGIGGWGWVGREVYCSKISVPREALVLL